MDNHRAVHGRLLVVDDEAAVRTYVGDALTSAGYAVETTSEGASALQLLCAAPADTDLLVVDVEMPHMTGFELVSHLRADTTLAHIPAIMLSGHTTPEYRIAGLRGGANDYIAKPVDPAELIARVETHLRVAKSVQFWRNRSRYDGLTGLLNRQGMTELVEHEIERSLRYGSNATIAFFDLDGFKTVNDQLGHRAGDDLLRAVARMLETVLRTCDAAARWGGDEFVIAFPDSTRASVIPAICRIQRAVADLSPPGLRVGLSAGLATLDRHRPGPRHRRAEQLIDRADREMYRDKAARTSDMRRVRPPEEAP